MIDLVVVSEGGSVEWRLSGGDISLTVSPDTELDTNLLAGANQISHQQGGGQRDNH